MAFIFEEIKVGIENLRDKVFGETNIIVVNKDDILEKLDIYNYDVAEVEAVYLVDWSNIKEETKCIKDSLKVKLMYCKIDVTFKFEIVFKNKEKKCIEITKSTDFNYWEEK